MFQGCARYSGHAPNQSAQTAADPRFVWEGDPNDAPWPVVASSWRDITTGVTWAASHAEFAIAGMTQTSPLVREYELVGLGGETGRVLVKATRLVEGALPSDEWITFEITLSLLGNDEKEAVMRQDLLRYAPKHAR